MANSSKKRCMTCGTIYVAPAGVNYACPACESKVCTTLDPEVLTKVVGDNDLMKGMK